MHDGQVETSPELVRRLLESQFPELAGLPIRRVTESGTDHDLYRVGGELLARLPVLEWAPGQAEQDQRWIRALAPHLPLQVPDIVAIGRPGEGYPWPWTLVTWFTGDVVTGDNVDLAAAAVDLAEFVIALQGVPTSGAQVRTGRSRGAPLSHQDPGVRPRIDELAEEIDAAAVTAAWEDALAAPPWQGPPVWLHADIQPGNLIVRDRRLVAVIDFGGIGAGDPAVDLMPAWNLFEGESRRAFLDALGHDDATRRRARGWVLAPALQGLGYYRESFPEFSEACRRRIEAVLDD
ncbi:aminoglycoside phosphotransferase family protein [Aeromicrobium sp. 9AM]|uniref:aminoglycoside phosphotransferase family protein n=1 Tax=Aeromicrobium sp. 9AM TaxID=2653126 RepID=UPI0012F0EA36|nr:aminoglycoside phosphotransferase family protein [Aeromicrobium sp. 9AM]VXB33399.1 Predicted kinase, aminoglycoside phosphotransferase (APT) family [Aeromicrobium sp. 9AM]